MQGTNGESEKFLFYRGVGNINAPLKISRDTNSGELFIRSQLEKIPSDKPLTVSSMWLVDIQPGGKIAFRALPRVTLDQDSKKILAHTPAIFNASDFSATNLEKLKAALQNALVDEGLFADEAQALLNTWELSYFKSHGLRVFFLVPRAWTDFFLPLEISLSAKINRVMVGRIELVTPAQRHNLMELSRFSGVQIKADVGALWTNFYGNVSEPGRDSNKEWNKLMNGKRLSQFISVPKSYQTYLDLGRFRNALVLDQVKNDPSEGLTQFISTYQLNAYIPE
ncbi:MAG: hypothetical protein ACR2H1_09415 [Limisphaerales bacterium]